MSTKVKIKVDSAYLFNRMDNTWAVSDFKVKEKIDSLTKSKVSFSVKRGKRRKLINGVVNRERVFYCECCGPHWDYIFTPNNPQKLLDWMQ